MRAAPGVPERVRSPSAHDLEAAAARGAMVPDVVEPQLEIIFCGVNPGRWSGAVGHHFAHPSNRFWKVLYLAGFTTEILVPAQERHLLDLGLGITNLVARTTASAADLSAQELRAGARTLSHRIRRLRPQAIAFLGLGAYRTAFDRPRAELGAQSEPLAGAVVWVLPNPSGLQARYGPEWMADELRRLRATLRSAAVGDK